MFKVVAGEIRRERRHWRIRKRIIGMVERPRLSVHRSHKNLYLQLIDDISEKTLFSFSTAKKEFRQAYPKGGNIEGAKKLGLLAASAMKAKGYERIVFDRGGYLYHGRIKALADALREGGLNF